MTFKLLSTSFNPIFQWLFVDGLILHAYLKINRTALEPLGRTISDVRPAQISTKEVPGKRQLSVALAPQPFARGENSDQT